MVTHLIRISKKGFYSDFFSENKSNLKKHGKVFEV